MKNLVIYIHGKGGNAGEAAHYRPFFPDCDVVGLKYRAATPWEARDEFPRRYEALARGYDSVALVANSIGAFFAMHALAGKELANALFLSPIVDMEQLIRNMMQWAGVTEEDLRRRKEIPTTFGETLSWEYLCFVREHPVEWTAPTHILYGENDNMTSYETMAAFAEKHHATLTVMNGGEHWFHTQEQMDFLDRWVEQHR